MQEIAITRLTLAISHGGLATVGEGKSAARSASSCAVTCRRLVPAACSAKSLDDDDLKINELSLGLRMDINK